MEAKRYQRFLGMVFVAFLCRSNLPVEGETAILLDKNQNSSWHWLTRFEFGPWSGWSRDGNNGGYIVCDLSETATNHTNNWLISEFIDLQEANAVQIEIWFTIRQCPSEFPYCKQTFGVYQLQTNGPVISGITKNDVQSGTFSLVDVVNATHVWTPGNDPQINQANLNLEVSRRGIYLAFQDTGACLALMSVKVSYTYCPSVVNHGVVFKKTAAPQSSQRNITVNGTCSDGASPYPSNSSLALTCLSSGQWVPDYKVTCLCSAGFELVGETCTGCQAGYYKETIGNGHCITCPSNTASTPSRDSCPCQNGFYRAPLDASNGSCTAPPSQPRNITITVVTDSVVMVTWSRPVFDGGRTDVKYDLRCSACSNMGSCSDNCLGAQFWPSKTDLITAQATLSNLDLSVLYNITVISKNGVSDLAGSSSLRFLHKTFSLTKEATSNPPSITTLYFSTISEVIASENLTTTEATKAPEQGISSAITSAAIGISVAVTFVICFVVAVIIIFLLMKSWRRKQFEQQSAQSSVTQLSDLSRDGTSLKRMRPMTTTTELTEYDSTEELQDGRNSPFPVINIQDSNSNSRPNSSSSTDWLPLKKKGQLSAINWTPPRIITAGLLPSEVRRKQSVQPLDLGDNGCSYLSPRKSPEGSEVCKEERSPSINSWFPAEEVQFNV